MFLLVPIKMLCPRFPFFRKSEIILGILHSCACVGNLHLINVACRSRFSYFVVYCESIGYLVEFRQIDSLPGCIGIRYYPFALVLLAEMRESIFLLFGNIVFLCRGHRHTNGLAEHNMPTTVQSLYSHISKCGRRGVYTGHCVITLCFLITLDGDCFIYRFYYTDETLKDLRGDIDLQSCRRVLVGLSHPKYDSVFSCVCPHREFYLAADVSASICAQLKGEQPMESTRQLEERNH